MIIFHKNCDIRFTDMFFSCGYVFWNLSGQAYPWHIRPRICFLKLIHLKKHIHPGISVTISVKRRICFHSLTHPISVRWHPLKHIRVSVSIQNQMDTDMQRICMDMFLYPSKWVSFNIRPHLWQHRSHTEGNIPQEGYEADSCEG